MQILSQLQIDIVEAFETYLHSEAPDVGNIYQIYKTAMREYLNLYPGIDSKVTFWPYEHVAASDTLVTQAQKHLQAYTLGIQGGTDVQPASNSYRDVLLAYAKTAWTLRDEN